MSLPTNDLPSHSINVTRMLSDHLPDQIKSLEIDIEYAISELKSKMKELVHLKTLNSIHSLE